MNKNHLNTNKQFMIGNGILAFGVIFVVVIFVYMSLRLKSEKEHERKFTEIYNIELASGFIGDSISIFMNDSLLFNQTIKSDSIKLNVHRFADHSAILVVDNLTENVSTFSLKETDEHISLKKEGNTITQE